MDIQNDESNFSEVEETATAATIVGRQYSLVRQILKHLKYHDLSRSSLVSQLWLAAAKASCREQRRRAGAWFGWLSRAPPQLHKHYELCGNNLLSYHVEAGMLKEMKTWLKNLDHRPHMVLAMGTGVAYIYYLITKNAHFVLQEEVEVISKLHSLFPPDCSMLFLTSLRIPNPSPSHDQSTLDLSLISIPKPTTNSEIKPFIVSDNELIAAQISIWKSNPLLTFDEVNLRIFEQVTNVPVNLIKGLVVLNTRDFSTIVRSVLESVGTFPLALAESEGLACLATKTYNMKETITPSSFTSNYSSYTSGLIMLGQDILVSSTLLDVDSVTESSIRHKLSTMASEDTGKRRRESMKMTSLGIMLTTCMRGYDGIDIGREHVEQRNKLQEMEASVFKDMFPDTELVAVQVEDVLGFDFSAKVRTEGVTLDKRPRMEDINDEGFYRFRAKNENLETDRLDMQKVAENEDESFKFSDSSTVFIKIDY